MAPVSFPRRDQMFTNAWPSRIRRMLRHATHLVIGGVVAFPIGAVLAWAVNVLLVSGTDWFSAASALAIGAAAVFVPPLLQVTQAMQRIAAVELLGARIAASADTAWPSRIRGAVWYFYSTVGGLLFVTGLLFSLPTLISTPLLVASGQRDTVDALLVQLAPGMPEATSLPWLLGICAAVLLGSLALGAGLRPAAEALLGPTQRELRLEAESRSRELARQNALARELHDSIGHALTVTTLQAGAARRLLAADPEGADVAMAAVELAGRSSLAELDEVLRILRSPSGYEQGRSLESLGQLVEQSRSAGLEVSASVPESTTAVPPAVSRAAFRIIQEGLTNAMKYAKDLRCSVQLEIHGNRSAGRLYIAVGNRTQVRGGHIRTGGRGLGGLKERAVMLGGTLEARETGGRWLLEAGLPWGDEGTPL